MWLVMCYYVKHPLITMTTVVTTLKHESPFYDIKWHILNIKEAIENDYRCHI